MTLPWRIQRIIRFVSSVAARARNVIVNATQSVPPSDAALIAFVCGFHRTTGATVAIASIANLLANRYRVIFVAPFDSDYNRLVREPARFARTPPEHADLFIVDGNLPLSLIKEFREQGKAVLVTAHGILPPTLQLSRIAAASATHFVSTAQFMHHSDLPGRFFVISNYCEQVITEQTNRPKNVGIVGRVQDPKKNVGCAIECALKSSADLVQVWGGKISDPDARVISHGWSMDKSAIFSSFSVLLSLSLEESFGLTVIEAMSAGIPCVLSDIPAHRQFAGCPGIVLVDPADSEKVVSNVDQMLLRRHEARDALTSHWRTHYSPTAVAQAWFLRIDELLENQKHAQPERAEQS